MIHDALDNPNMQIWRKCENQTTGDNLKYNFAGNTKGGQGVLVVVRSNKSDIIAG